jgi:hypothetical protein
MHKPREPRTLVASKAHRLLCGMLDNSWVWIGGCGHDHLYQQPVRSLGNTRLELLGGLLSNAWLLMTVTKQTIVQGPLLGCYNDEWVY